MAAVVVLVNGLATTPTNPAFDCDAALYAVPGTLVVAMYGFVLVGPRFARATPLVGSIVGLTRITPWRLDTPHDMMVDAAQVLLVASGILTVGANYLEMTSRPTTYAAEQLPAHERHARAAKTARIDWMENPAHFLAQELRNSVVGVKTLVDLLEQRAGADGPGQPYCERARQGLKVIQRLLESASEASSVMQDPVAPLDLAQAVEAQLEVHRLLHPGVTFELGWDSSPPWVESISERMAQVMQNLLTNAVDHHRPAIPSRVSLNPSGPWARLAVENLGQPLPPEGDAIVDLFASFRAQTEPGSKGGFGLYLVRLIAERYGGTANASDLPGGEGVRFEVRLPLVHGAEESPEQALG